MNALRSITFRGAEDQLLRRLYRGLDLPNEPAARRRNRKRFRAPIMRAIKPFDELLLLQTADHAADGRAVEGNDVAERRLIDPRVTTDRDQCGILHWRDVESLCLIEKQREGNLMQPADQMAGHFEQAPIILQLPHRVSSIHQTKIKSGESDSPIDRRALSSVH